MPEDYRHIVVDERAGVLIITIQDQQIDDWDQSESIRKEMVDAFTGSAQDKAVVDLRNVDYMSSVGYGPFLSLQSRVNQTGGRLMLSGLNPTVEKVFHVTRLMISPRSPKSVFEASNTLESAIRELSSAS